MKNTPHHTQQGIEPNLVMTLYKIIDHIRQIEKVKIHQNHTG